MVSTMKKKYVGEKTASQFSLRGQNAVVASMVKTVPRSVVLVVIVTVTVQQGTVTARIGGLNRAYVTQKYQVRTQYISLQCTLTSC